jgi:DNA (cytosine-5)-methyltransferase 1
MPGAALRVGSLCSGYEGIFLAVKEVFPSAELVFTAENDPDASQILAQHFPGIPNYGDIKVVDWKGKGIEIDLLTAGFPCQDVSLAGTRRGLVKGSRTGLWLEVARAIDELRPPFVFLENVLGLLSGKAHSDLEPCPWCMGDGSAQPFLRALGAVLGDLASRGYDAQWATVRASEVGAPHRRERVFIFAHAES